VSRYVCLQQLRFRDINELRDKILAPSFAIYQGKHRLVVASKNPAMDHPMANLQRQSGVEKMTFESLHSFLRSDPHSSISKSKPTSISALESQNTSEYTPEEVKAVRCIKAFWQYRHPKMIARRAWMQIQQAQVVAR